MALLKNVRPWLTAEDLQLVLTLSAVDLGISGTDHDSGYGLVNMAQALDLLENNTCTGTNGHLYFSIDGCKTTPKEGGGIFPVIQLLLGTTTAPHERNNGSPQSPLTGKNPLTHSIFTHEGYHESTI